MQLIKLVLQGEIRPKARPRVTSNGTYMPLGYVLWKESAIAQLQEQFTREPIAKVEKVEVHLIGKHPRRSDADNILGSILDSLVQAKVLKNDNLMCIPEIYLILLHGKESPIAEVYIYE